MAITTLTPQNGADAGGRRISLLADMLGHSPPAGAHRALLAGDPDALGALLGDERGVIDALPRAWWLTASADAPGSIIFTGFEPFGGHAYNPSWTAAQAAARAASNAWIEAQARLLPVTFEVARGAPAALLAEIPPTRPALLVHLGLAADRRAVCLERYAHNTRGATADNAGLGSAARAPYDTLEAEGPCARETLLPLERIIALMGVGEAEVTRDPGAYVCNATYYAALGAVAARRAADGAADALFVHVPMLSEQGAERRGAALGAALAAWLVGAAPV
jgi:pyroglutamyl-peptidase